ncbi:hypothetical protein [Kribbella sp. NPDC050459]|uniref:hypothetical protein n=1 Tax=Kribbella sp. NPDC050459 TaxID=3155785 RepID=UPI0033EAD7F6
MQRQVDPRGDAARGDERAVVDDPVGLQLGAERLQLGPRTAVRRGRHLSAHGSDR